MDRGIGVAWKKSVPKEPRALPESQLSILAYLLLMSRDNVSASVRQMSRLPTPEPGRQTFLGGLRIGVMNLFLGCWPFLQV